MDLSSTSFFVRLSKILPVSYTLSHVVLIITAGVLFYVALTDLKNYKIRNEFVLVLAGLYLIHAIVSGRWAIFHWNLAFAALMFIPLLFAYSRRMLGGGDVKILTVAFLWTGPDCALLFGMLLLGFSTGHLIAAKLKWVHALETDGRSRIPYAPSVAAALIGTFMLGCLAPLTYTSWGPLSFH
jgi:prepilin peptidase CpaA